MKRDVRIAMVKKVPIAAPALLVLVLGFVYQATAETQNVIDLRQALATGGPVVTVPDGFYQLETGPLVINRSVTVQGASWRGAWIFPQYARGEYQPGVDTVGFKIGGFGSGSAFSVTIDRLVLVNFKTAIEVLPQANIDDFKTLAFTVNDCDIQSCYYGIRGIEKMSVPFSVSNFNVYKCFIHDIRRRDSLNNQGGIRFETRFANAAIGGPFGNTNTFDNTNTDAILLGTDNDNYAVHWSNAVISYNTITNVWNNNSASGECHGIRTYGNNHTIQYNTITDLWSVHESTGCEGIYSKAQGLTISNNTLTNAGGNEGMIAVKTGTESEFPNLVSNTFVENNDLNRTRFEDVPYTPPAGQGQFTAKFDQRHNGKLVKGNHATIQYNQLGDGSGTNGALRIVTGRASPATGLDIEIINNTLYTPPPEFLIPTTLPSIPTAP